MGSPVMQKFIVNWSNTKSRVSDLLILSCPRRDLVVLVFFIGAVLYVAKGRRGLKEVELGCRRATITLSAAAAPGQPGYYIIPSEMDRPIWPPLVPAS